MTNEQIQHGFWSAFHSSRCKTAMLILSIIITTAFCIDQIWGNQNQNLTILCFSAVFFWSGRMTKAKENLDEANK